MNFTREPIIETIISPKEGYKLVVRNSKHPSQEEHSVDALEVVSFGSALFYRSLERPKCFLLPVADYEVMEARETRVVLKNAHFEKNIKISGGKEPPRMREQPPEQEDEEMESSDASQEEVVSMPVHNGSDRKRDRRRNRRKRMHNERPLEVVRSHEESHSQESSEVGVSEPKPIPVFTGLIPPPTTLISETIARYRETEFITDKPPHNEEKISAPQPSFPSEGSMGEPEENPGNSLEDSE